MSIFQINDPRIQLFYCEQDHSSYISYMWEKWKKNPDHFSPDMLAFRMNNVSYIHEYKGDTFLHLAVDGLLGGDVYKRKERVLKLLHLAKNHYFEEGKDFIFAINYEGLIFLDVPGWEKHEIYEYLGALSEILEIFPQESCLRHLISRMFNHYGLVGTSLYQEVEGLLQNEGRYHCLTHTQLYNMAIEKMNASFEKPSCKSIQSAVIEDLRDSGIFEKMPPSKQQLILSLIRKMMKEFCEKRFLPLENSSGRNLS
ncbi:putative uncharacterized protein [Parachlamydia acanthamoebae UV-7]|uniref:Uncharacterized protein n=2 Tax=Parachlamydia acanthamoebae TaxID=83552 RepID=F8KYQ1_PARAV|nr:hypothetical protein [Parachlamydia acanthamoebae]CCB86006.1 putative uncharacterized protein [Parachlamydia acanthamoebae UV-7]